LRLVGRLLVFIAVSIHDKMDDHPSKHLLGRSSALRIGSYTFPATLLLMVLAAWTTVLLLPALQFALGSGWFVGVVLVALIFGGVLVFRKIIFRNIYHHVADDGDTALLEYLVQHNISGAPGEEEIEAELLDNAMHLKEVRASECMTPRLDIVHIDADESMAALRNKFIESSLSRILITDGELDKVLGYIHVQQMFGPAGRALRDLTMPIAMVPESIHINDLLSKFISQRSNIVCVVDEFGSLSGLVTLEDALEQLFGEIDDEHDREEFIEQALGAGEYRFSGRLEVDYLNENYPDLQLPTGDYNTLSGMIITESQTIPEQGLTVEIEGKMFFLEQVSDRKIEMIRMKILD
jgi:putative hemolysin